MCKMLTNLVIKSNLNNDNGKEKIKENTFHAYWPQRKPNKFNVQIKIHIKFDVHCIQCDQRNNNSICFYFIFFLYFAVVGIGRGLTLFSRELLH